MKQPTFHGRVLLPLSVFAEARAGDPLALERVLRYYDRYINKITLALTVHKGRNKGRKIPQQDIRNCGNRGTVMYVRIYDSGGSQYG